MKFKINKISKEIVYTIDTDIYQLKTLYAASHLFTDRAFVFLKRSSKKTINIHLKIKDDVNKNGLLTKRLKLLAGEFNNEILNQALRESISNNNKSIREYIVLSAVLWSLIKKPELKNNKLGKKSTNTNV